MFKNTGGADPDIFRGGSNHYLGGKKSMDYKKLIVNTFLVNTDSSSSIVFLY